MRKLMFTKQKPTNTGKNQKSLKVQEFIEC